MAEFRAVYMRCTQEQFERMRPKLERLGCELSIYAGENIKIDNILSNNVCDENIISNIHKCYLREFNGNEVHTEAEFLKACGYVEEETLQEKEQRLIKELKEVQNAIKENEPKVGDICIMDNGDFKFIMTLNDLSEIECFDAIKLPKELQEQLKPYLNDNKN